MEVFECKTEGSERFVFLEVLLLNLSLKSVFDLNLATARRSRELAKTWSRTLHL